MTRVYSKLFLVFLAALLIVAEEITIQITFPQNLFSGSNLRHDVEDRERLFDKVSVLTLSTNCRSSFKFIQANQPIKCKIGVVDITSSTLIGDTGNLGLKRMEWNNGTSIFEFVHGYASRDFTSSPNINLRLY